MNTDVWLIGMIPGALLGILMWFGARAVMKPEPGMDKFSQSVLVGLWSILSVLLLGPIVTWAFTQKLSNTTVTDAFQDHLIFSSIMTIGMFATQWGAMWYRKRCGLHSRPWIYASEISGKAMVGWMLGFFIILGILTPLNYLWLAG